MNQPFPQLCLLALALLGGCGGEPPRPLTAQEKDRRELVRQPREEWKPAGGTRRLNILLLAKRDKIRAGEAFSYRVEMQNVDREPLVIKDPAPSFTKDGSLCGAGAFGLRVTPPRGKERLVPCKPGAAAETQASTAPAKAPPTGLEVTLQPGEYLLTRGSAPGDPFRDLRTAMTFETLGTYALKAVYTFADGTEAVSNAVAVEVVP